MNVQFLIAFGPSKEYQMFFLLVGVIELKPVHLFIFVSGKMSSDFGLRILFLAHSVTAPGP